MPKFSKFRKYSSYFLTFCLGILVASTFSVAAVYATGNNNLIRACVNKKSGELKILLGNKKCSHNEELLQWNKQGPTGPQGPQGPQGQSGTSSSGAGGVFVFRGGSEPNLTYCSAPWGYTEDCPSTALPIPNNGKLTSLSIYPYVNTNTAGSAYAVVLINGVATGLEVFVPLGSTNVVNAQVDVPVSLGDLITLQSTNPTGNGVVYFSATLQYVGE